MSGQSLGWRFLSRIELKACRITSLYGVERGGWRCRAVSRYEPTYMSDAGARGLSQIDGDVLLRHAREPPVHAWCAQTRSPSRRAATRAAARGDSLRPRRLRAGRHGEGVVCKPRPRRTQSRRAWRPRRQPCRRPPRPAVAEPHILRRPCRCATLGIRSAAATERPPNDCLADAAGVMYVRACATQALNFSITSAPRLGRLRAGCGRRGAGGAHLPAPPK